MNSKSRASKLVALAQNGFRRSRSQNVPALPVRQSARLRNVTKVSSPTVVQPVQNFDVSSYDCHEGTTVHERELLLSRKNQLFTETESCAPNLEETSQPLMSSVISSSTRQDEKHDTHNEEPLEEIDSSVYVSSSDSYVPSPNKLSSYESSYNTSADKVNSSQVIDNRVAPIAQGILSNSSSSDDDDDDVHVYTVKKVKGKRKRDKLHCCYFCNKLLSNNMARHFEKVHKSEVDVSRILAFPKGSAERRKMFASLIGSGDFYYNCNALSIKKGRLILVRRPDKKAGFSYSDFAPCPNCLGFMAKKYIWHHMKHGCTCTTKKMTSLDDIKSKRAPLNESAALLFQFRGHNFSEAFQKEVVSAFRLDDVSQECKGDDLILKFGAFMFEKYGTKQLELIRQTMRQVGRLKVELKKIHQVESMSGMLTPANFDTVVTATKNLCETYMAEDVRLNFKIPSLALKIGHHLRKCIAIERGTALRSGNMQRAEELRNLLELINLEWSTRISSNALASLHKKKLNATQLLPLTSDLIKLNSYLINEIKLLTEKVRSFCNRQIWAELASVTLCRVILFNKRRSGEASRMMTLENYSTRPSWNEQTTSEFKDSLSPVEKELANRLAVVQIIGKRNRVVPVIMPEDVKVAIDTLIKTREEGDISPNNSYVFARSVASRSNRYLHGHQCLRKACQNADLECAQNITSTKLRKYMATVCQIFDLKEHECDWLARHLGHDLTVHRDFYRMHESAIELTKVSRLLLAVESGKANRFAGRQLHEINVEELPDMEEDDGIVDAIDEEKDETNNTDVTDLGDADVNSGSEESGISEDSRTPSASNHFTKNKNKRRKLTGTCGK